MNLFIHQRARGGSNRVSHLTLVCESCNRAKGSRSGEEFLKKKPAVLGRVLAGAKCSLALAPADNVTRSKLVRETGGSVRAEAPSRKKEGIHIGRIAMRKSGFFDLHTMDGKVDGSSHCFCKYLQRGNGYRYTWRRPEGLSTGEQADRKAVEVDSSVC